MKIPLENARRILFNLKIKFGGYMIKKENYFPMMDRQKKIEHQSLKLSVREILDYENKLNAIITTNSEIEK